MTDQLSDRSKSDWGSPVVLGALREDISPFQVLFLTSGQAVAQEGSLFSCPLKIIAGEGAGGPSPHLPRNSQLSPACPCGLPWDLLAGEDPGFSGS